MNAFPSMRVFTSACAHPTRPRCRLIHYREHLYLDHALEIKFHAKCKGLEEGGCVGTTPWTTTGRRRRLKCLLTAIVHA